jgi:hypothetical protein
VAEEGERQLRGRIEALTPVIAIVVTGLVGIFAPVVATRNVDRQLDDAAKQADRAEARGVLDKTTEHLARTRFVLVRWARSADRHHFTAVSTRRRIATYYTILGRDHTKLALRFGPDSVIVGELSGARAALVYAREWSGPRDLSPGVIFRKFSRAHERFDREAFAIVGSRLDIERFSADPRLDP